MKPRHLVGVAGVVDSLQKVHDVLRLHGPAGEGYRVGRRRAHDDRPTAAATVAATRRPVPRASHGPIGRDKVLMSACSDGQGARSPASFQNASTQALPGMPNSMPLRTITTRLAGAT